MATKKKTASDALTPKAKSVSDLVKDHQKKTNVRSIELRQAEAEDYCSTGCLSLDIILGGGYFGGDVTQFFGPAGSGKSTNAYASAGCLHKKKVYTVFDDYEGTTKRDYAMRLGVPFDDPDMLAYFRPANGEEGYARQMAVLQGLPDKSFGPPSAAFFIDSIAMMPTPDEMESWEDATRLAQRAAMHSTWVADQLARLDTPPQPRAEVRQP